MNFNFSEELYSSHNTTKEETASNNNRKQGEFDSKTDQRKVEGNFVPRQLKQQASWEDHRSRKPSLPKNNPQTFNKDGRNVSSSYQAKEHPRAGSSTSERYSSRKSKTYEEEHNSEYFDRNGRYVSTSFQQNDAEKRNSNQIMRGRPKSRHFRTERNPSSSEWNHTVKSEIQKTERVNVFSFTRLKALSEREKDDVVMALTDKQNDFFCLFEEKLRPDMIMLLAIIMAKISSSSLRENKTSLLVHCAQTKVLEIFSSHSYDIASKDFKYKAEDIIHYFENLSLFYMTIVEILPKTASEILKEHLLKAKLSLHGWSGFKSVTISSKLYDNFDSTFAILESLIDNRKSVIKKGITKSIEWKPSRTPFREVSELPLPQDMLRKSEEYLYANIVEGPYTNVEHYLNVHFYLMREDFIIPLRDGIMQFVQQRSNKDRKYKRVENVRFYRNVRFLGQYIEGNTILTEVLFDSSCRTKKIQWKRSKRFKYGSLVCFSSDNFNSLVMGLIVERDVKLLENGILVCELIGDIKGDIFKTEFIMAESEVYFESYHHVLKGLKHFNEENLPLQEYIIKASHEIYLPKYLANNPDAWYFYEDNGFQVLDRSTWPDCKQLNLNESQLQALHSALTQRLVVIQGPPGTGKTYLGLVIAKILLNNSDIWRKFSGAPILVVCYTNHALDQFLEGMLTFTDKIVRVGGQSKNEKLANYNLRVKKRNIGLISHALWTIEKDLEVTGDRINRNYEALKEISKRYGILSLFHLRSFISNQNKTWFLVKGEFKDSLLVEWLSEGEFFQNYYDTTEELYNDESMPPDRRLEYACNLMELKNYLLHLDAAIANPEGFDIQELMYMKELYMTRFHFINKKLNEPTNNEMNLIVLLEEELNLKQVPYENRWVLYNHWVSSLVQTYQEEITAAREVYKGLSERKMEIVDKWNLETMRSSDIVGITTTGAARQQNLLQNLGAKIVIVEEAAEVMESHVVVSLSSSCEHLILIGDHKQLRPSPAVYELAKKYKLDISLFERMLMNEVPYTTLNIQHRMRPEIADLIIPAIYPSLENHQTVLNYEKIFGVKKNLFFINHANEEEMVLDDTSKKNIVEAQFMIAFSRHLILQGYDANQITILTTYIGQMFCIIEEREKNDLVRNVQITCVDNFQGEENDIILLSLVRNNKEGKIGFLAADNRVCVALSRAKKGLYIMGNIDILSKGSSLWKNIKEVLEEKEAVGTHLTLECLNHDNQLTNVCKAEDFINIREGGCTRMCDARLPCGHSCKQMCHMMGHEDYKCYEACEKKMCILDHRCKKLCWEKCGDCLVPVEKDLPCGHRATLACHEDPEEYKCIEAVNAILPECEHTIVKHCYIPLKYANCTFPCDTRLPCGHACEKNCHVNNDPEHLNYKCIRPCGRKNSECKEEHMCQRKCFEECSRCTYMVKRQLPNCDHFYDMKCSVDPDTIECKKPCKKSLSCGHKCRRKCYENCGGCQVVVEKEIPDCHHKVKIKCCDIPQRSMCNEKCERILKCGHTCEKPCRKPCEEEKCISLSNQSALSPCGHKVRLFCYEIYNGFQEDSLSKRCREPCKKILECSHLCKGTCGACMQGRIHIQCLENCGKNLICGHKCTVSCSQSCPPCKKNCFVKCDHTKCKKKCGFPCVSCKEKCPWNCEHLKCNKLCSEMCERGPCNEPCQKKLEKCQHPCIGYCGEKCPPLCRICDKDELEEVQTWFGSDDENARFILLPECNHVIDSVSLERWLEMDDSSVKMKVCPICSTPIQTAYRFGNIVKQHFVNVIKVKSKVFGKSGKSRSNLSELSREIKELERYEELRRSAAHLRMLHENIRSCMKKSVDAFLINSLEARGEFILALCHNFLSKKSKLDESKKTECASAVNDLITVILRSIDFISTQEHSDFTVECKRFYLLLQLSIVESTDAFKTYSRTTWYTTYTDCRKLIYSERPFPLEDYDATYNKIDEIYKQITARGVGLSKIEMDSVVRAINLHQGHWNLCPNGHVYAIADCGRAMVEGICNECGARIGGGSHNLLPTNTRLENVPQGLS